MAGERPGLEPVVGHRMWGQWLNFGSLECDVERGFFPYRTGVVPMILMCHGVLWFFYVF